LQERVQHRHWFATVNGNGEVIDAFESWEGLHSPERVCHVEILYDCPDMDDFERRGGLEAAVKRFEARGGIVRRRPDA